jgi:hypothetical protein
MKQINILLIAVLIPGFLFSQSLKSGIAYARIPDLQINGLKFGNQFSLPISVINLDFGIDFILGRGNPNVVFSDSMNYNILVNKVRSEDWYVRGLVPWTTSLVQFQASMGISKHLYVGSSFGSLGMGAYLSRSSSHFLVGPYNESDVFWAGYRPSDGSFVIFDSEKRDIFFPVNIRYFNLGLYFGGEWVFFKDMATPVGVDFKYYAGYTKKRIITFGLNIRLPVKSFKDGRDK